MLNYHPLNTSREELRVISIHQPSSASPCTLLECSLEHVSLRDYSHEYGTLLQREKATTSAADLAMLWDLVTNPALSFEDVNSKTPADGLVRTALNRFSNDPVYRQASFTNARRYSWGDFCALSYEWGDPKKTAEMMVDGHRITVTQNLEAALRGIGGWWHGEHTDGKMKIWIDALCINQKDILERNAQVKRMKGIYSHAACVLAWTGEALEEGQKAATGSLLKQIVSMAFAPFELMDQKFKSLLVPENEEAWRGLVHVACRSYWQRLWIIQEIILANTGSRICFGADFTLASHFFNALSALSSSPYLLRLLAPDLESEGAGGLSLNSPMVQGMDRCDQLLRLHSSKYLELPHPPLNSVMATGRSALQSDKRDKVYGLLGLMDSRIVDAVVPDYDKSLEEVYHDFAVSILVATGRLDTLLLQGAVDHGQRQNPSAGLPSWVPDWSLNPSVSTNADIMSLGHYRDIYLGHFKASAETLHVYRPGQNAGHLLCRGFLLDTIDGLGCSHQPNTPHDEHDTVLPTTVDSVQKHSDQSPETLRNAFWETLTLGGHIPSDASMAFFNELPLFDGEGEETSYYHVVDRFQSCNGDIVVGGTSRLSSIFPPWTDRFEELPDDADIMSNILFLVLAVTSRRFGVTSSGHMILGPNQARKGDGIYLLKGCNVPLILRARADGTRYVVGECYVHGFMNGEAMAALSRNEFEETDIIIH